jgi:hypothetical protein
MLTLFALPKAFDGHSAVIQRNALRSWTLLQPSCEILLLGDEEGTAGAAAEFGVRHVPEVARSARGLPLISSIFEQGQRHASHDVLCYVNADIILMDDFMRACETVHARGAPFLLCGRRWDVDVTEPLSFEPGWEGELQARVRRHGALFKPGGIDYFVFSRGVFGEVPPYVVGRPRWDNWMLYRARARGARLIDGTEAVMAVHQNHVYAYPGGKGAQWGDPEGRRNVSLYTNVLHDDLIFTVHDAPYVLTPVGLRRRTARLSYWRRYLRTLRSLYPSLGRSVRFVRYLWRGR